MGVYIKGMDMPRSCKDCLLRSAEPNFLCSATNTNIMAHICFFNPPRPKGCPLVEIPTPHGRLVDADEITKDMNTFQDSFVINVSGGRFGGISCTAKTIVESEE